ncbi:MAG: PKD domain-containing protein [Bacteroidetes bacterium]|nr:PKD domain-containing protein [Bacteroidota bacterium]MBP6721066.1 PKD domain-containing protein [Bacteroidia bacterium]
MRKTLSVLSLLLLLLSAIQSNAQSGCNATFGYHHSMHSLTLQFGDASTSGHSITSWLWDFGDGHTSTAQNPTHTFAHHGVYNVCLTIHDSHGCSHTSCHHITVNGLFSVSHHHPVHHLHHAARFQGRDIAPVGLKSASQKE